MAKTLVPLTLELIDEGRFMRDANEALRQLEAALVQHWRRWGDASVPVKGKLTVTVELEQSKDCPDAFMVISGFAAKRPAAPKRGTASHAEEAEDGTPALLVRASGSGRDSPRQSVIFTEDGARVDTATGEVVPAP